MCALLSFQLTPVLTGKRLVNASNLKFFYRTMKTRFSEEVLLYDFYTIVGIVGGSLGLFLGFSCFSVVQKLLSSLNSRLARKY